MTRNNLDNPFLLFFILVIAVSLNAVFSIHFLLVMLAGVLFTAFYRMLRKRYLYSLSFVVIAFLLIEINSGLKPFSLSLLSLFIYVFILPRSENSNTYSTGNSYLYILFFYIGLVVLWGFTFGLDEKVLLALFINFIIDLIFFGAFL